MNDDNMLVKAIQAKTDETQKALDLFKQLHQQMHAEMESAEQKPAEAIRVTPPNSPQPA